MNFLLKIVEGPNKGAEIALVEGVDVTLGKGDDCDIVLADPTLPDEPFRITAAAGGVTLDGEALELFHVKAAGSTAFAVGPAGEAWGELVWPKVEREPVVAEGRETADERQEGEVAVSDDAHPSSGPVADEADHGRRRHGCLGCLLGLIVLLLILLGLAWFFRNALRPKAEELWGHLTGKSAVLAADVNQGDGSSGRDSAGGTDALSALAVKYGLVFTNDAGRVTLSGNFRTRAERLAATAEAYESQPGVELDFSDDESFHTAAADALFTLTEGSLQVVSATNRILSIAGVSPSAAALKRTLEELNADLPKLRGLDVSGVVMERRPVSSTEEGADEPFVAGSSTLRRRGAKRGTVDFPVCGILTTPYPCLVMQNGARILEGATIGDSTILKIEADSVVVTNVSGRFIWKP